MHNHSHVIEFSIGVSFVLGVLHALEPGHGKSAMFVYMLQQRKSFWHPIVMGVTTGLSHAASLMVIALAVHLGVHLLSGDEHAGHQHAGEALQWISSVLLVGIGLRLFYLARRGKISKKTCSCCREAKVAPDSTVCSTPAKPVGTSMRMTVLLGIAVGLLPCPTALAAYFAGVSSGNPTQGYLYFATHRWLVLLFLAAALTRWYNRVSTAMPSQLQAKKHGYHYSIWTECEFASYHPSVNDRAI